MVKKMLAVGVKKDGITSTYVFPWKVSIVAFMANPVFLKGEKVEETLTTLAKDPFFDLIELGPLKPEHWRVVEKLAEETGVEFAMGAQPYVLMQGYNPSATDEAKRREFVKKLKEVIDEISSHGVYTVAFSSGPDPGPEKRDEARKALVQSLLEVTEYAKEKGVIVVLETFDRDWDKKQLIGPIAEAVEVAKQVRKEYSNFGLLWDLSHAPMLGEKPEDLKVAADYLVHIHIGCTKKVSDGSLKDWHPGFYRPGAINGVEEVEDLLRVLKEIGYDRAIGFEVKPEEGQLWLEVVNAAKGVLYTAFANYVAKW
ncbi:MAG TPA: sugar phosphate isomerase/epimerase [Thermofilum sp.]|nr:sugar phosphate isomerase/epimerase [Thermofilum sp.]